jgi:prepilin-type N-terminal cleavage/methylation domain-containing protein
MPRRAFTLVELLVVIAIIGLLSTIAITSMNSSRVKAKIAAGQQYEMNIYQGLGDRIIGDWSLDETAGTAIADISGNGNNGTLAGPLTSVPGVFGNALNFNGSNFITINNTITTTLNSFTVSAWFKTTNASDIKIVSFQSTTHPIQTIGGQFRMCFPVTGCVVGTRMVNDGNWHFATVTGDGTSIRGYIDGTPEATAATNAAVITNTLYIGGCSSGYYFAGAIDQVRLYGAALTARAIKEQYLAGLTSHPQTLAAITTP